MHKRIIAVAVLGCAFATMVIGHPDDPKVKDIKPRYEGPGWRAATRGDVPLNFQSVGVKLESWISVPDFGDHNRANDCWGYTSPAGREYAIIGLSDGTAFVEVTDPANPEIVTQFAGPSSIWRDIKTYQTFAYAVSEGGEGIQVFDLSNIDAADDRITQLANVTTGGSLASHNVAIDTDSGFLYRCGGASNGLRMYDLDEPTSPEFVASWPDRYVHDAQIRTMDVPGHPNNPRQIAFCCSGFNNGWDQPGIDILDVTDKQNIVLLSRYEYPNAVYSHQAWLSDDNQYLYLNDELDEGTFGIESKLIIIDVSDLSAPFQVDPVANGNPAITHNLYAKNNHVYAANYTSGLRIFDTSNPTEPVEVAWFDTVPNSEAPTYNGLWSNYPYFPSGTVIGSDIERGLFVWSLEIDQLQIAQTSEPTNIISPAGATVSFDVMELDGVLESSSVKLLYDTGSGFSEAALLGRGGGSYDATLPELPCGATVRWYIEASTTGGAVVTLPALGEDAPFVGLVAESLVTLVADDAETDLGWIAAGDAVSGGWERGVPVDDAGWPHDPSTDGDGSGSAWLTGNAAGNTDVDEGSVALTGPVWDLSSGPIVIEYKYFLKLNNDNGDDALAVEMSVAGDGGPWTEIARHSLNGGPNWQSHTITPDDLADVGVTPSDTTVLRFTVNDDGASSIVEAGLDGLLIRAVNCVATVPGDATGDGAVGLADLLAILAGWGECEAPCPPCDVDLDGDCSVGLSDLLSVLSNWGAGG